MSFYTCNGFSVFYFVFTLKRDATCPNKKKVKRYQCDDEGEIHKHIQIKSFTNINCQV